VEEVVVNILQALAHKDAFRPFFDRRPGEWESWATWRTFLRVLEGLPLNADDVRVYRQHTERLRLPRGGFRQAHVIAGRRSGKSMMAAVQVTFRAAFVDYSGVLAPGETGLCLCVAASKRQAQVTLGYVKAFFQGILMLRQMVVSETADGLVLNNRIRIEVLASDPRSLRGHTVVCAVLDELAFIGSEVGAITAEEIVRSIRPSMLTIPNALLLGISSPYAKRGLLWQLFRKHFGKDDQTCLIWKAPTHVMNPSIPLEELEAMRLEDPASARAEIDAEFRDDVSGFVTREVLERCVVEGRVANAPGRQSYRAFCDPSGGIGDSMTAAIGHLENGVAIVDCILEKKAPFSPEQAVEEFAAVFEQYGVIKVVGDAYSGMWAAEGFGRYGITYKKSEKPRSELYLAFLARLNSKRVELLDHAGMLNQFVNLERKTARSGKDTVRGWCTSY
jgi:hypothetical protein